MKLCVLLGVPPSKLAGHLTSEDYTLFRALYRIDPWDADRIEVAIAKLTALIYNVNRGKDTPQIAALEFLPYHKLRRASMEIETDESALWSALHAAARAQRRGT